MAECVRHRIPVAGRRTAAAPATCAQRHIWNLMQRQSPDATFYDVCYRVDLPGPGTARNLLDVFAELLRRHESLRTGFHLSADGTLRQQVLDAAEFEAEVWSLAGEDDPDAVLHAWQERMRHTPFEHARPPLIRFVAVVVDGAPVRAAFCVSHLAVDLTSVRLLAAEIGRLLEALAAGRPLPPAVPARQPVDQAEWESTPRGRALQTRAHAHWRRQLAGAPATLFPAGLFSAGDEGRPPTRLLPARDVPDDPTAPPHYSAAMDSRAAALALSTLARSWRVSTSAVLVTVVARLLGRRAGLSSCALRLLSANRSDPEVHATVANLHSEVVATIDLTGDRIEDVARRAFAACTAAYANGLYDPDEVADLIASAHGPGVPVDTSYCFNDVREGRALPGVVDGRGAVSGADLRAAMGETVVAAAEFEEAETFFLVADDEEPGRLRLVLDADRRALTPSEVHDFLYAVERSLVEYAEGTEPRDAAGQGEDPAAAGRVAPPSR
ncbi:condensation domain-containing protein [Streptomyces sp. NPDC047123]|uniref:condensation domain-containing protein n=1 Tax=Streptomyces sp. NPDC047123 TaxID=3155622 RepID=UPI0033C1F56D